MRHEDAEERVCEDEERRGNRNTVVLKGIGICPACKDVGDI